MLWLGAAHVLAVRPWIENGLISRRLSATLQREVPRLAPGAIVIVDARELRRNVFLWFWACPQALGRPFLEPPLDPSRVLTRGGLYYRPEQWQKDIHPLDLCRTANGALVIDTTDAGQIRSATLSAPELAHVLPALEERANNGDGLHSPELSGWVDTVLRTHSATKKVP